MAHIKLMDNGPLLVNGGVELLDAEGNNFDAKDSYALCRCGASKNKPFCDGSHSEVNFTDATRAK